VNKLVRLGSQKLAERDCLLRKARDEGLGRSCGTGGYERHDGIKLTERPGRGIGLC
jgi:hypothetical protein